MRTHVQREGLRPLSARTGIPVGQLRSLLHGRAALSTTIELASAALGLEFYVGPPRAADSSRIASGADTYSAGTIQREPREPVVSGTERSPAWAATLHRDLRTSLRDDLARLLREFAPTRRTVTQPASQTPAQPVVLSELRERPDAGYVAVRVPDLAEGSSPEIEQAPVVGYFAFQRSWLERHALDPDRCTSSRSGETQWSRRCRTAARSWSITAGAGAVSGTYSCCAPVTTSWCGAQARIEPGVGC